MNILYVVIGIIVWLVIVCGYQIIHMIIDQRRRSKTRAQNLKNSLIVPMQRRR